MSAAVDPTCPRCGSSRLGPRLAATFLRYWRGRIASSQVLQAAAAKPNGPEPVSQPGLSCRDCGTVSDEPGTKNQEPRTTNR